MRKVLILLLWFTCTNLNGQQQPRSQFDGAFWGLVLQHPDMSKIKVQQDVPYWFNNSDTLKIDIYYPQNLKKSERRPVVVFLNSIGYSKSSGLSTSWPRLVAVNGYVAITMETKVGLAQECFHQLFQFLSNRQSQFSIDASRIGIYAASANIREASKYLMGKDAYAGVKAAALYYGEVPIGPYRRDLPVQFVIAEKDTRFRSYNEMWNEVTKTGAPWTIKMGSNLPHAFDAFSDTESAKRIIMETISFWKNNLEPIPSDSKPALAREIIALQYDDDFEKVAQLMELWFQENSGTTDAGAYSLLGNAYMRIQKFEEAAKANKKSLELNANNTGVLLNMVVVSYALGKTAEAEDYLKKYEAKVSPEGFTYGYIGRFVFNLKNYSVAKLYFERSVGLGPHPTDYYNLGVCYAVEESREKAFENLFLAVEKGVRNKAKYEADDRLQKLKSDSRWVDLMKKLDP